MLIETERLLLRPLVLDDLEEFVALYRDPEVTRFVRALDRAQARERLRAYERGWKERGYGVWAVVEQTRGLFLGRVGFIYWPQFAETELGWVLRRDAWGYGYATEAGRACLDWAFATLAVPYFTAMINAENARSIGVARRIGFRVMREDSLLGDPVIVHAIGRRP